MITLLLGQSGDQDYISVLQRIITSSEAPGIGAEGSQAVLLVQVIIAWSFVPEGVHARVFD